MKKSLLLHFLAIFLLQEEALGEVETNVTPKLDVSWMYQIPGHGQSGQGGQRSGPEDVEMTETMNVLDRAWMVGPNPDGESEEEGRPQAFTSHSGGPQSDRGPHVDRFLEQQVRTVKRTFLSVFCVLSKNKVEPFNVNFACFRTSQTGLPPPPPPLSMPTREQGVCQAPASNAGGIRSTAMPGSVRQAGHHLLMNTGPVPPASPL